MRSGPRNLISDVAGLRVGNAAEARLKSGVTVLTGDAPFTARPNPDLKLYATYDQLMRLEEWLGRESA